MTRGFFLSHFPNPKQFSKREQFPRDVSVFVPEFSPRHASFSRFIGFRPQQPQKLCYPQARRTQINGEYRQRKGHPEKTGSKNDLYTHKRAMLPQRANANSRTLSSMRQHALPQREMRSRETRVAIAKPLSRRAGNLAHKSIERGRIGDLRPRYRD